MKSSRDLVYKSSQPANDFYEKLCSARASGLFCDGLLVAQEKSIKVHRVVVAIASPYFKNLFEMSESNVVECHDIPPEDLEYIISYLYSGKVHIPYSKVKDILSVSRTCGITELAEACRQFLEENFSVDDAFGLRKFASQEGHFHLCKRIDDYLKDNFAYLYQSEAFLLLPRLQVTLIASQFCSNHDLENTASIFERVLEWVQKRHKVSTSLFIDKIW